MRPSSFFSPKRLMNAWRLWTWFVVRNEKVQWPLSRWFHEYRRYDLEEEEEQR